LVSYEVGTSFSFSRHAYSSKSVFAIGLDAIGPEVYSACAPEDAIKKESNFSRRSCIEIPFAMQNHWQLSEMVGTGRELQPLADNVSGAWLALAPLPRLPMF
jgi:hypothetical protein